MFCLIEVLIAVILEETVGYKMELPGDQELKKIISFFISDLKVCMKNLMKNLN